MVVDDTEYNGNKQYYQVQKCIEHKPQCTNEIMQVKQEWMPWDLVVRSDPPLAGVEIMKRGLKEKFKQETYRDFLLATGGVISEDTKHSVWAIGWSIQEDEALKIEKWSGSNII